MGISCKIGQVSWVNSKYANANVSEKERDAIIKSGNIGCSSVVSKEEMNYHIESQKVQAMQQQAAAAQSQAISSAVQAYKPRYTQCFRTGSFVSCNTF